MGNEITVKSGDNLTKIVRQHYGLNDSAEINNVVNLIKNANNLKDVNSIYAGQKLILPEQLSINNVSIFNHEQNQVDIMTSNQTNYYRATDIFGDVATKKTEFPEQEFVPSALNETTKATPEVEDVVANVSGLFVSETPRDAKMADIFAKQIGTWEADGQTVSGGFALEKTDAYRFILEQNTDDYMSRTIEYNGKKEEHAYFGNPESDNNITLFSLEVIEGKEYFTVRDKDGVIHYFDKSNNLSEAYPDGTQNL